MQKITGCFILFVFFLAAGLNQALSQVSVNTNGAPPNSAAMLDVQSTNKGILIPRIDFNNRPNPAPPGLMIFVTANGPVGNNALYIYDGTGWSMVNSTPISFSMGQHIGGGVVFYVDQTGNHGLISSTVDESIYALWGCFGTLIGPGAEHMELGTGDTNTTAIVNGCSDPGIAAKICDTLTLNGYTDWYLPAIIELDSMYVHRDTIGNFSPTAWYWSSTEINVTGAYFKNFYNGTSPGTTKAYGTNIRCIRKF